MNVKQVVVHRIMELCKSRSITIHTLVNDVGVPPATIYSMLNTKSRNPGIVTIKQVCDSNCLREFLTVLYLIIRNRGSNSRAPANRPMRGILLVQEILVVHIVQRVEFVLGADTAIQRLAVAPELDILQAAGNSAIPVGVEGIEGD